MALYFIKDTTLKGIADAIRTKTGDSASIPVADFASEIESIVVGDGSSSGGGSGNGDTIIGYEVITKSGTFETGSGVTSATITHNCGGEPDIVIVFLRRNDITICGDYTTFVYSTSKTNVGNLAITSGYAYQGESGISCSNTTFNVSDLAGNSRYGWYAMKLVDKEISASGGDYTVTFMSEDGKTKLYEKQVMEHDTCATPVTLNLISKPTKASTAQYEYAFSGWATTQGGAASSTALTNITGDKTVYAAFKETVRKYTVNFYDGTTLLKTEQVAYGAQATPPDTKKDGYRFVGWTPSDLTITADTDFVGEWGEYETVLAPTEYSGFAYSDDFGAYRVLSAIPISKLSAGINLVVEWDGVAYECTTQSTLSYKGILAGKTQNLVMYDFFGNPLVRPLWNKTAATYTVTDNGLPFLIIYNTISKTAYDIYAKDGSEKHTVGIYKT